jgi:hypothetical protein
VSVGSSSRRAVAREHRTFARMIAPMTMERGYSKYDSICALHT